MKLNEKEANLRLKLVTKYINKKLIKVIKKYAFKIRKNY